jgi:hypothetical protein
MFENQYYRNRIYLYLLDLEIIEYKRTVMKDLYNKMNNNEISYDDYYTGKENVYYWNLMKQYANLLRFI